MHASRSATLTHTLMGSKTASWTSGCLAKGSSKGLQFSLLPVLPRAFQIQF